MLGYSTDADLPTVARRIFAVTTTRARLSLGERKLKFPSNFKIFPSL